MCQNYLHNFHAGIWDAAHEVFLFHIHLHPVKTLWHCSLLTHLLIIWNSIRFSSSLNFSAMKVASLWFYCSFCWYVMPPGRVREYWGDAFFQSKWDAEGIQIPAANLLHCANHWYLYHLSKQRGMWQKYVSVIVWNIVSTQLSFKETQRMSSSSFHDSDYQSKSLPLDYLFREISE